MTIKAVIFDLDGTITKPFFDFDAIRQEMGLDKKAGPILEAMEKMTPKQRKLAEKILHRYERQAVEKSRLNIGARKTLSSLRKAGIKIGILTRNKRHNVFAVAVKYNLQFDEVVDRDDGPVKPDGFGVTELCRRFGVKPKEPLVVGDYLFDLLCAKAAGAAPVLLANHHRADEFEKYADFTIKKIGQILDIVRRKKAIKRL